MAKTASTKRAGRSGRSSSSSVQSNIPNINLSKLKTKLKRNSKPALDFVSQPLFIELAVLGAAGFVIWKNRERIQSFLDEKGIDIPGSVSEKFNQWFRSGEEEQQTNVRGSGRNYAQ